jgi:hypothetical protein
LVACRREVLIDISTSFARDSWLHISTVGGWTDREMIWGSVDH